MRESGRKRQESSKGTIQIYFKDDAKTECEASTLTLAAKNIRKADTVAVHLVQRKQKEWKEAQRRKWR